MFGSDARRYADEVQDHIDHGTSGQVAGFIAETIQVCGFDLHPFSGCEVQPASSYFKMKDHVLLLV